MDEMKMMNTKYSGLTLNSLKFLASLKAPVDKEKENEVWLEIFNRYFSEGRAFDVYEWLIKRPMQFIRMIELEFQNKGSIPDGHTKSFNAALDEFIKGFKEGVSDEGEATIEQKLTLVNTTKSVMEKLKDDKIKNSNCRQAINEFLETIDLSAERLLEEMKKQNALIPIEMKLQVKPKFKTLDVQLYKLRKEHLLTIVNEAEEYKPEEIEKIIFQGMKKYPDEVEKIHPARIFLYNMNWKIEGLEMTSLLRRVFSSQSEELPKLINLVKEGGDLHDLKEYLYKWYMGFEEVATQEGFEYWWLNLISNTVDNDFYREYLVKLMLDNQWIIEKYQGKTLSELLRDTVKTKKIKERGIGNTTIKYGESSRTRETERSKNWQYKYDPKWRMSEPEYDDVEITVLEQFYKVYWQLSQVKDKRLAQGLFEYKGSHYRSDNTLLIDEKVKQHREVIEAYIKFIPSIKIDCDMYTALPEEVRKKSYFSQFDRMYKEFNNFIFHKFCRGAMTYEELKLLFMDTEINLLYESVTRGYYRNSAHDYVHSSNFYFQYFSEVLKMFDFTKEDHVKKFFNLNIQSENLFEPTGLALTEEQRKDFFEKLHKERPAEYDIVSYYVEELDQLTIEPFNIRGTGNNAIALIPADYRKKIIYDYFILNYRDQKGRIYI